MKQIVLAGGCFWGLQKYLDNIQGVVHTQAGYANGKTENPTYEQVCTENTGHAEAVRIEYDESAVSLELLLDLFYNAIDPTSVNRQGGDRGTQYRSGVYYTTPSDLPAIQASIRSLQKKHKAPIAIEVLPLENYAPAEEEHQKYLDKHPGGYCHIGPAQFKQAASARVDPALYTAPDPEDLQHKLTPLQYQVTQESATEPPFRNEFNSQFTKGIYVDITTGEPLFVSSDKFESGCGWPSFSRPVDPFVLQEYQDNSLGVSRTEVRSRVGNAHLGHVFDDGPAESGGLRYCINSAALRFVPEDKMEAEGYGAFLPLL